jgi:5-methylcytosine-specific restriction enzyme subunit McrC
MTSPPLTLHEFEEYPEPVELTVDQRDWLSRLAPSIQIRPAPGAEGTYLLRPASEVGAIRLGELSITILPKRPVRLRRVLYLAQYALDRVRWPEGEPEFDTDSLVEAIVPVFVEAVRRAFARGLLQGYRVEDDSLLTVRGRVRFDDQLRYRFGRMPPVEVRFDDFTEDIEENRLIRAALSQLRALRLQSATSRRSLASLDSALERVSLVHYDPGRLPEVHFTRLNEHYRGAIALAKLVLRATALEIAQGRVAGAAFLVDMNVVFEEFVRTALRESLGLAESEFPVAARGHRLHLDEGGAVRLLPDLSWWDEFGCRFVGDVKYKRTSAAGVLHPDLYQLLAYLVATDLPAGLLVYAAGEGVPAPHRVVHLQRTLEVVSLDLAGSIDELSAQIDSIATRVSTLARRVPAQAA